MGNSSYDIRVNAVGTKYLSFSVMPGVKKNAPSCFQMDNLGFQHDVEEASRSVSEDIKNRDLRHGFGDLNILPCSNGCNDSTRGQSTRPKNTKTFSSSPKLSSCSFTLPKNRTSSKYRRFSESFSCTSRVPHCMEKVSNIPSREGVKHDNIKCSSFIISGNNNVIKSVPDATTKWQQHAREDGSYIEVHCNSSNPLWSDEYQPNNSRICSSQNFQGHNSASSLLNNIHESSNYTSVPSLPLNNSYHEEYLSSMPSFSRTSLSLSYSSSNKQNLVSDTSLDIHKTVAQPPKYTNKYRNLVSTQAFLNNAQGSRHPSPYLMKKKHQISKDDADLNSLRCIMKSQKNVNHILNRATTLPAVTIRNVRNGNQEFASGISTVSGAVPMCFSGFVNRQQPTPSPCAENRQNMRRSSKALSGGREATLKKRTILRGWKLQFIPSYHSNRRTIALCSVLLLACILVLVATGLVIYMTTGQQIY